MPKVDHARIIFAPNPANARIPGWPPGDVLMPEPTSPKPPKPRRRLWLAAAALLFLAPAIGHAACTLGTLSPNAVPVTRDQELFAGENTGTRILELSDRQKERVAAWYKQAHSPDFTEKLESVRTFKWYVAGWLAIKLNTPRPDGYIFQFAIVNDTGCLVWEQDFPGDPRPMLRGAW